MKSIRKHSKTRDNQKTVGHKARRKGAKNSEQEEGVRADGQTDSKWRNTKIVEGCNSRERDYGKREQRQRTR